MRPSDIDTGHAMVATEQWPGVLFFLLMYAVLAAVISLTVPTAGAADSPAYDPRDEARTLTRLLREQKLIQEKQKAYWTVGASDIPIHVYGVTDNCAQETIIETLAKARDARKRSAMRVTFYPDEAFKTTRLPSGAIDAERTPSSRFGHMPYPQKIRISDMLSSMSRPDSCSSRCLSAATHL
jgi:hypothetical protein